MSTLVRGTGCEWFGPFGGWVLTYAGKGSGFRLDRQVDPRSGLAVDNHHMVVQDASFIN